MSTHSNEPKRTQAMPGTTIRPDKEPRHVLPPSTYGGWRVPEGENGSLGMPTLDSLGQVNADNKAKAIKSLQALLLKENQGDWSKCRELLNTAIASLQAIKNRDGEYTFPAVITELERILQKDSWDSDAEPRICSSIKSIGKVLFVI